eukprot:11183855-Lingulodinium_polyedra.AAC.1
MPVLQSARLSCSPGIRQPFAFEGRQGQGGVWRSCQFVSGERWGEREYDGTKDQGKGVFAARRGVFLRCMCGK